ncbi:hypothetical protein MMC12_007750 [Toensbergia leucococca]|nr:hypothetical protein [Toensbergia leucococca]
MSKHPNARIFVLTASVAAITATGAWYGAGVKTKQEIRKENKVRGEVSPTQKLFQLEQARGALVAKRIGLERKIMELEARQGGASSAEASAGRERR